MDKYEAIKKIKDSTLQKQKMEELTLREGSRRRLFIGRTSNNNSGLFLYDKAGKPRMEIFVDSIGAPHIKVLDEKGNSGNVAKIINGRMNFIMAITGEHKNKNPGYLFVYCRRIN